MDKGALRGRTAFVTGGSRGIGRAVVQALAAAGAHVATCGRSATALDSLTREVAEASGANVQCFRCDLTDAASVAAMIPALLAQANGSVEMLVSNAGVFPLGPVTDTDPAQFEATIQANLIAPFRVLQPLLVAMQARKSGHLVTIGSVADRQIFAGNGAYAASKFGARALHEVLRQELTGSGVRTTLLSPAATDTPIWDPIDPDNRPGFPPRAAMLRAEDVADAVLWALTRPLHVNVDELRLSRA